MAELFYKNKEEMPLSIVSVERMCGFVEDDVCGV